MSHDEDRELLIRVTDTKDFVRSVLVEDNFDDWKLAQQLGEFLIRIDPEGFLGHLILARACRHQGDRERAMHEFDQCRSLIASGRVDPSEQMAFAPEFEKEQQILLSDEK